MHIFQREAQLYEVVHYFSFVVRLIFCLAQLDVIGQVTHLTVLHHDDEHALVDEGGFVFDDVGVD